MSVGPATQFLPTNIKVAVKRCRDFGKAETVRLMTKLPKRPFMLNYSLNTNLQLLTQCITIIMRGKAQEHASYTLKI